MARSQVIISEETRRSNETKEERLLNEGLDFNMLFVLQNPEALTDNVRVSGWKELCKRKGFMNPDGSLTEKGLDIIALFPTVEITKEKEEEIKEVITKKVKEVGTFSNWVKELHKKVSDKLYILTGTKTPSMKVDGKNYPYMCGVTDLEQKIKSFIAKYDMKDLKKIEACILKHAEVRNQKLMFYIIRQGSDAKSDLSADYENFIEEVEEVKVSKKDLF